MFLDAGPGPMSRTRARSNTTGWCEFIHSGGSTVGAVANRGDDTL